MPAADAASALGHVYWLCGGSGAGKSTVARRLAGQVGCQVLGTDDVMADHGRREPGARNSVDIESGHQSAAAAQRTNDVHTAAAADRL